MRPIPRFTRRILAAGVLWIAFFAVDPRPAAADFCSVDALAGQCPDTTPSGEAPPSFEAASPATTGNPVRLELFYAEDCPHCHEALVWLPELERKYPNLVVETFEITSSPDNRRRFEETARRHQSTVTGVPMFFLGGEAIVGFYQDQTCAALLEKVHRLSGFSRDTECESAREIQVPLLGTLKPDRISMFNFTVILGLLDSFNPCAIWVLTFLLSILVHSRQRGRIAMIGTTFVLASGFVYFAFMAAWLNLFAIIGMQRAITLALGAIAIGLGAINIKELFWFKKGVSLTISDSAKSRIAQRVRGIMKEQNTRIAFAGTAVLAVLANFVELGCTVGFPAIYTKILAAREPSTLARYAYMLLYNVVYIVPLAMIVAVFTATLGHYRLTEKQGRFLKLISGVVMFALGLVMLFRPDLLVI